MDELIEELAKIEHQQWMHWSQAVAAQVPPVTREKWKGSWVDYDELTDELKEADRVWARRVVTILRQCEIIK
jgi:hypothetical protein